MFDMQCVCVFAHRHLLESDPTVLTSVCEKVRISFIAGTGEAIQIKHGQAKGGMTSKPHLSIERFHR